MIPTAPSTSRAHGTGEALPEFFEPVPVSEASYDHLADALTRQIIALLKDGTIWPGDVLYLPSAVMDVLTGNHSATARQHMTGSGAGTVTDYVARRYGLLRHRPVRVGDQPLRNTQTVLAAGR